jgi:hypothetical protein
MKRGLARKMTLECAGVRGSVKTTDRAAEPRRRRLQGAARRNISRIFRGAGTPQTASDRLRGDRSVVLSDPLQSSSYFFIRRRS